MELERDLPLYPPISRFIPLSHPDIVCDRRVEFTIPITSEEEMKYKDGTSDLLHR